jgi:SAM-dependent methyltransferase
MSDGDHARFFDAVAGRYDRVYALSGGESRRRMDAVLRELPRPPATVLDLGVGTGRELSALLDAGYAPTGVDISGEMLDRCVRRSRPVPVVRADFWRPLPFPDGSFDATVALHGTLAHPPADGGLDCLETLAREMARVVRPGGIWVAEVPSPEWLDRLATLPAADDREVQRTGPRTFAFTDRTAGASILGRVFSDQEWRDALGRDWRVRVEPLGELELRIVATRP